MPVASAEAQSPRSPHTPPPVEAPAGAAAEGGAVAAFAEGLQSLQAAALALAGLAHSELRLSLALLMRALLLSLLGLLVLAAGLLLGIALLVALGLAAGLGWAWTLALVSALCLLTALAAATRARRHLRDCGLPQTRQRLQAWLERAP